MLSFDDYGDIAARLDDVVAGKRWAAHEPRDRRKLLPLTPAARPGNASVAQPGHGTCPARPRFPRGDRLPRGRDPGPARRGGARPPGRGSCGGGSAARPPRRSRSPRAATGGAASAPSRRSAARSSPARRPTWSPRPAGWPSTASASCAWSARTRPPTARTWATCGCWRRCCRSSPAVPGIARVRVSYLQPAEVRPGLVEVMAATPGVAPYFDLSFQHASGTVLRSMRRFGDGERFLGLIDQIRAAGPGRPGSAPTSSSASPARRRTTSSELQRVPDRGPAGRHRRLRLLRRGRHRGGRRCPASWTRTRSPAGSRTWPPWPTS